MKTALFGIQHVLVMFTAMVGGPLIVARLLDLPTETRIDMIAATMLGCGVGSRFVVAAGGAFLILMALIPKVGATIALIPAPVLGGVLLVMFGMVASVGADIIGRNLKTRRDALVVACALGVGLDIQVAPPHAFDVILPSVRLITSNASSWAS